MNPRAGVALSSIGLLVLLAGALMSGSWLVAAVSLPSAVILAWYAVLARRSDGTGCRS